MNPNPNANLNKRCCHCKRTLPIDNFYNNKNYSDGHGKVCKECTKLLCKRYYKKNKKRYYYDRKKNPEFVKQRNEYQDKLKQDGYFKEYYAKHKKDYKIRAFNNLNAIKSQIKGRKLTLNKLFIQMESERDTQKKLLLKNIYKQKVLELNEKIELLRYYQNEK